MEISHHLKYPLFLHHLFLYLINFVSILCGVMFIIMVLGAQILVSRVPVGSTHIGKQIFQKVNKFFVKINMLVFMEDVQLILKTITSI